MNGTDISIDEQIRAFAASVRRHLDDLPEEELDDILGGLTADLTDQAADNDGVLELGDPAAYAEELRSAAGLPPRADASKRPPAFGAWLLDFLVALRPVWWVLRGFAMFVLLTGALGSGMMPTSPASWLFAIALIVVSVQWGRGRWLPRNWIRHVRTIVSVVAVAIMPFALASVLTPRVEYVESGGYMQQGLLLDGVQITTSSRTTPTATRSTACSSSRARGRRSICTETAGGGATQATTGPRWSTGRTTAACTRRYR